MRIIARYGKRLAHDRGAGIEGLPLQLLIMVVVAGLGLTIVDRIVEVHGGEVTWEEGAEGEDKGEGKGEDKDKKKDD